jgi:hypothetical protein
MASDPILDQFTDRDAVIVAHAPHLPFFVWFLDLFLVGASCDSKPPNNYHYFAQLAIHQKPAQ